MKNRDYGFCIYVFQQQCQIVSINKILVQAQQIMDSSRIKQLSSRTPRSHILIQTQQPEHRQHTQSARQPPPLHKKVLSISISKHSRIAETSTSSLSTRKFSPAPIQAQIPNPIVRKSTKSIPPIDSYAVSTHHGLYHLINEDKVSIHLGKCAVFGVFDGYGGSVASDFLKEKMVIDILREKNQNMEAMLTGVFARVDGELVQRQKEIGDRSGSSALICIVRENILYVANTGTSFAFGKSSKDGKLIKLSNQHNCENRAEYTRITSAGGRVYQTKVSLKSAPHKFIEGPLRIHPYGLTVTRTMGHVQAKTILPDFQRSDPGPVIICKPEIRYMKADELQWVCLCSQGLLNTLTPTFILQIINTLAQGNLNDHDYFQRCAQEIMKSALKRGCRENATVLLIKFTKPNIPEPSKQATHIIEKKISLKYIGGKSSIKLEK